MEKAKVYNQARSIENMLKYSYMLINSGGAAATVGLSLLRFANDLLAAGWEVYHPIPTEILQLRDVQPVPSPAEFIIKMSYKHEQ